MNEPRISFRILGPFEVVLGNPNNGGAETVLNVGPLKQRAVLAMLLISEIVSMDQLVDALWDNPPRTAVKNIHVYISHLRRILAAGDSSAPIISIPSGYRILLDCDQLDLTRFETLARDGRTALREGRRSEAADLLRQALDLWRGPALAELHAIGPLLAESGRLEERRLAVHEDWFEAKLELGHHADVLEHSDELVRRHPLRERLRSQHILALYQAGRQSEAFAEFDDIRQSLARELGLQPSPALGRLYEAILRGDPALLPQRAGTVRLSTQRDVVAHMSELPRDIDDFTGRAGEVAEIVGVLTATGRGPHRVVALSGAPGVGKTCTAVHGAYQVMGDFPDGQLLVCFRKPQGGFRSAFDVLTGLLRRIDVRADRLAPDTEALAAAFRSWLSERRMLLILDDAPGESHVRPLLPGAGGSQVIITSRRYLGGVEAARHVELAPLPVGEALALLGGVIGHERVAEAREAAEHLVRLCGLLPLTIRIAGAKLNGRRHVSLRRYAERLAAAHRLTDELSIGDLSFRGTADGFLDELGPAERSAFLWLGLLDRAQVRPQDIAALLDVSLVDAERVFERLIEYHVLLRTGDGDADDPAYELIAPFRAYAAQRLAASVPEEERAAARARLASAAEPRSR